jgi:hypothetical protein
MVKQVEDSLPKKLETRSVSDFFTSLDFWNICIYIVKNLGDGTLV